MLATMTSRQLAEWQAYAAIEPFGEERADLRMGILAALIANVNRGKQGKRFEAKDFMPQFGRAASEPQTVEQQMRIAQMFTAAYNSMQNQQKGRK